MKYKNKKRNTDIQQKQEIHTIITIKISDKTSSLNLK